MKEMRSSLELHDLTNPGPPLAQSLRRNDSKRLQNWKKLLQVLEDNVSDPFFNVNRLADDLDVSTQYLHRICIKHFQVGPQKMIEKMRIQKAILTLSTGTLSDLAKLSGRVGYLHYHTFRQAFKRCIGVSPIQLRKHYG